MATPIGGDVGEWLEPVRNPVVDLLFVRVRLRVRLADTLCDDALVAFRVASVLAVLALHPSRVFEEIAAQGAAHNVVELVLDELVPVHLVDLLLPLTNSALTTKTDVDWSAILVHLVEIHLEVDRARGFQVEPAVNGLIADVWNRLRPKGLLLSPWRAGRRPKLRLLRSQGKLRWWSSGSTPESVSRNPPRVVYLSLDPLSTHLLDDVGYPHPQHGDG